MLYEIRLLGRRGWELAGYVRLVSWFGAGELVRREYKEKFILSQVECAVVDVPVGTVVRLHEVDPYVPSHCAAADLSWQQPSLF